MQFLQSFNWKLTVKIFSATFMLVGLVVFAAQDVVPNISYTKLFGYIFLGLAVFVVNLVGLSVIYLNVHQWVLRKGGTDVAWFWFSSESKGMIAMREKLRKEK